MGYDEYNKTYAQHLLHDVWLQYFGYDSSNIAQNVQKTINMIHQELAKQDNIVK